MAEKYELPPVYGTTELERNLLDPVIWDRFKDLDQGDKCCVEYVWIGGTGVDFRSKTRVVSKVPKSADDLPSWNYDGSSTGQAPGDDSEVFLKPCALFRDPFRPGNNFLVMCDTYEPPRVNPDGTVADPVPLPTNTRYQCAKNMEAVKDQEPWFGIEQEYTVLNSKTKWPLGWPQCGFPGPQGPYYCSAGAGAAIGRDLIESHMKACIYSGINISGVNAEVMPSQWEYQVGPSIGISAGDEMMMSRYLLTRCAELYNVEVTFDPKPIPGDWNGAGGHVNFSNNDTRAPGVGWDNIQKQIEKIGKRHAIHIAAYGEGNERRLTGKHETSSMHDFSWGVANRGCSIRVGRMVPVEKCGYYEDRRPASNLDPYVVTGLLVESALIL
eukprot:jgi/Picsp_1/29/NSC_00029-R1_glutamine synthetase